jgi:hypothetical protein
MSDRRYIAVTPTVPARPSLLDRFDAARPVRPSRPEHDHAIFLWDHAEGVTGGDGWKVRDRVEGCPGCDAQFGPAKTRRITTVRTRNSLYVVVEDLTGGGALDRLTCLEGSNAGEVFDLTDWTAASMECTGAEFRTTEIGPKGTPIIILTSRVLGTEATEV